MFVALSHRHSAVCAVNVFLLIYLSNKIPFTDCLDIKWPMGHLFTAEPVCFYHLDKHRCLQLHCHQVANSRNPVLLMSISPHDKTIVLSVQNQYMSCFCQIVVFPVEAADRKDSGLKFNLLGRFWENREIFHQRTQCVVTCFSKPHGVRGRNRSFLRELR